MSAAELIAAAAAVRARAYAPYSGYAVGAAIRGARRRRVRRLQRRERRLSRRASAPRPTRSASWWPAVSGRSPRWRWSAAATSCARPAAAAGSAWPSSAGPTRRSISADAGGLRETTTLGAPPADGVRADQSRRRRARARRCRHRDPPARRGRAARGRDRPGLRPRRHRRADRRPGHHPRLSRPAGLPAARACRAMPGAAARPARRRAGACLQGRAHLYEGVGAAPLNTLVRTLKAVGCRALLLTNASGSLRPDLGARLDRPGRGPHQPAGHQPAGRPQRRCHRPALRRPDRGLQRPPARGARRGRCGARHRARAAASTSPCSAPPSRPRPRSAPTARWARTSSACRPCPRRSAPGMPGLRSRPSRSSPTSPPGLAAEPLTHAETLSQSAAAVGRVGDLIEAALPEIARGLA